MKKFILIFQILCFSTLSGKILLGQDTFSIVAVDSVTGEVGSAGASCVDLSNTSETTDDFLSELLPGVGAIVVQAAYNKTNQKNARNRMNAGDTPKQIIDWLVANDVNSNPGSRQYGVSGFVNGIPKSEGYTGSKNPNYKNHLTGSNYSVQGNTLLGIEVTEGMEAGFINTKGNLACKLMAAMQGANIVGADSRCKSNGTSSLFAFIKVSKPTDDFGSPSFLLSVRTRNGQRIEPIDSLQNLFDEAMDCSTTGTLNNKYVRNNVRLSPNPVRGEIRIDLLNNHKRIPFIITDVMGKIIYEGLIVKKKSIWVGDWKRGMYFLKINDIKHSQTIRFVIN